MENTTPMSQTSSSLKARRRWVTVEPVVVLAMLGHGAILSVKPYYFTQRVSETHNVTDDPQNNSICRDPGNTSGNSLEDEISAQAALYTLYSSLAWGIPAIFATMIWSTMSDRLGRKFALALPVAGYLCQDLIFLSTVYFNLPVPVTFAGDCMEGFTGGFSMVFAGGISYISDVTTVEQRTFRIVVLEVSVSFFTGANYLAQGYLISATGYYPSLGIATGFHIACLLYIFVPPILYESVDRNANGKHAGLGDIGRKWVILLKFNENGRRYQLILLYMIMFTALVVLLGSSAFFPLYTIATPFCWNPTIVGIANAYDFTFKGIATITGTKLFSMCLGDYWLIQIGSLCNMLYYVVMGLAKTTVEIFIAITVGVFKGLTIPVLRSVISKISKPDEMGTAFAIVGGFESLANFAAATAGTGMYAATVAIFPPLAFFFYAAMGIVPIALTVAVQIYYPRAKQYIPLLDGNPTINA